MDRARTHLVKLLAEAHTNELALVSTLTAHLQLTETGNYRSLLKQHLDETKDHARRIERRLQALGYNQNLLALAYDTVQGIAKQAMVMVKGPIDALRGGTNIEEKMLRNAMDEAMTEGLEIAAYDTIESVARILGDHETAELAADIRLDEERMFDALRKQIPALAEVFAEPLAVESGAADDEPWDGYDAMSVDEIEKRLESASSSLVIRVRAYEQQNKDRATVIRLTERLVAV